MREKQPIVGLHHHRTTEKVGSSERERVFAELWAEREDSRRGMGHGGGILQDLMIVGNTSAGVFPNGQVVFEIDDRDRTIAATLMQWLGSNVGFGFLEEMLRRCGFYIVSADALKELQAQARKFRKIEQMRKKRK